MTSPTSLPPVPDSPTASFTSTAVPASSLNLPFPSAPPLPRDILSHADTMISIQAYETLLETAKCYRKSLAALADTASAFGAALEGFARCRAAGDNAHGILNAGGLQYLIASSTHILSEILYRGLEVPLLHELDGYKEKIAENEERYRKEAKRQNAELKRKEQEQLRLAKQKKRNMSTYRSALVDLTRQIDELDKLKYDHYRIAHSLAVEASNKILDCSALVVRAEVEIFEKVAQKGWDSSGGLDDLIARSPDPFAAENRDGENDGGVIFSILPAQSILPSPQSPVMASTVIGGCTVRPASRERRFTDTRCGEAVASTSVYSSHGEAADPGNGDHPTTHYRRNSQRYHSITSALSLNGEYTDYEDEVRSIFNGGFSISSNVGSAGGSSSMAERRDPTLPQFLPSVWAAGVRSDERSEAGGKEDTASTVDTIMPQETPPRTFPANRKDSDSPGKERLEQDEGDTTKFNEASTKL